ncbi:MAG: DUF3306 domain-containing protein [Shewanella sp.]|uniref:DUF3306 domain-containing protein n=1 Tax=Shewanella sp. TaxID=50422 RepID=UPI003F3B9BD1
MTDPTLKTSGFFSRWTQRRERVAAQETLEAEQTLEVQQTQPMAEPDLSAAAPTSPSADTKVITEEEPQRILTAADLPNPEEIEIGGSFASFMGANVDPAAKTAALRALWKQPHFNEIDGLLEYALDYSNQPKLSPEVSAELAKKVFRFMTDDQEEQTDESHSTQVEASPVAVSNAQMSGDTETVLASTTMADNLEGEADDLPQNAPELATQTLTKVV